MITPQEASKRNDAMHAEQLKAAEKAIDAILARSFVSGRAVSIDVKDIPIKDHILRDKLLERYRQNGWTVKKQTGDQRDWYENYQFSAKRTTGGPRFEPHM